MGTDGLGPLLGAESLWSRRSEAEEEAVAGAGSSWPGPAFVAGLRAGLFGLEEEEDGVMS